MIGLSKQWLLDSGYEFSLVNHKESFLIDIVFSRSTKVKVSVKGRGKLEHLMYINMRE